MATEGSRDFGAENVGRDGGLLERLPSRALGTPARYWIDTRVPELVARVAGDRPVRLLDLGCHDGAYLQALRTTSLCGSYLGIDIAPSPAWETFPSHPRLRHEFRVHDAHAVAALEPPGFDVVLSIQTFEHFRDDARVLEGVVAQLRSGGALVLCVPSHVSYVCYGRHGFRRYGRRATAARLRAAGLEVTEVHEVGGLASFLLHGLWFRTSHAATLAGKGVLRAAAGFDRARMKRRFARADAALNGLMFLHQRAALGRTVHARMIEGAAGLDAVLRGAPVSYCFVAQKR